MRLHVAFDVKSVKMVQSIAPELLEQDLKITLFVNERKGRFAFVKEPYLQDILSTYAVLI